MSNFSKGFWIGAGVAVALIVADLWAHPQTTNQVLTTSQTVAGYVAGK